MSKRAQSAANVLLHKLERKTDYQIRYEILEIIKELPHTVLGVSSWAQAIIYAI
jgi:hypothetical protein